MLSGFEPEQLRAMALFHPFAVERMVAVQAANTRFVHNGRCGRQHPRQSRSLDAEVQHDERLL